MQTAMKPETKRVETKRLLMSQPKAYDLLYEINAWMHKSNRPDKRLAWEQWQQLYDTITQQVGIEVELVEQAQEAPDMVFTANAGFILPNKEIVLSRFRHPERQVEEPYFEAWFRSKGYDIHFVPPDCAFEGEGDAFLLGDLIVAGYRKRSDICSHRYLSDLTGLETLSLELVDDRWYHLDTCFLPLHGQTVAYYPEAFDWYARRVIQEHFQAVPVSPEEALKFACNSIVLGKKLVMPAGCPNLRFMLEEQGYTVFEVPMTEFIKSGGACKCLALCLIDD